MITQVLLKVVYELSNNVIHKLKNNPISIKEQINSTIIIMNKMLVQP